MGFTIPEILSSGHSLVELLDKGNAALTALMVIFFAKFLFSVISFGSGAPGGIFFPLLILGAFVGAIYGTVTVNLLDIDHGFILNFVILAMAGYFSAIVRAHITGMILILEMTGSFTHLLSLKRNGHEIIPKGGTKLRAGDTL